MVREQITDLKSEKNYMNIYDSLRNSAKIFPDKTAVIEENQFITYGDLVERIDILAEWRIPYMLTPGFDTKIVQYALCKGIEVLPGVLTPSEVQQAVNCGIRLMKLFPADAFGKGYIKALKGPFPDVDFVAVGGVTAENASEFYRAGFQGVAAGSNLVPRGAGMADVDRIRERARRYVRAADGSVTAENNA